MIDLALSSHSRARVWFGELPKAEVEGDEICELDLATATPSCKSIRMAAVELMIPRGAVVTYGLLGAELHPSSDNRIRLQLNMSSKIGEPFSDSPVHSLDDVFVGLPREYVPGVLKGIFSANEEVGGLPAGKLVFNRAAHGHIGSSEHVFMVLSHTVLRILTDYDEPPAAEDLLLLFKSAF